jgi:segregation and condensation protein B
MEDKEIKSIIESILFMAGEPVSPDSIKKIMEIDKKEIERLTKELISEYSLRNSGLLIVEVAGGVQMVTNPACSPWVKKLLSTAVPTRLSQPSLETIAIIAYKQPIIKSEIEAIRGVNSDGVVKTLLERRLIKILGRKEVPGRPLMYGTTKEFLQYFGLKDLSEMPTLKEFEEVNIPEPPETLPEESEVQEITGAEQKGVSQSAGTEQDSRVSHEEQEEDIVRTEGEKEAETVKFHEEQESGTEQKSEEEEKVKSHEGQTQPAE